MCCCQNSCFCCCCRTTILLLLTGATILFLLFTLHPAFAADEDVVDFHSQDEAFRNNAMGGPSARANNMVDRLIQLMQSSALISPQLNNITVERTLDLKHGTIEDLNIQGLVAGMQRSGDAVLSVSGTRFGLAMPISLRNVTVRALHRRSSPVGGLQAAGVAHLDVLTTRFRVSLGTTGMNLDDFKLDANDMVSHRSAFHLSSRILCPVPVPFLCWCNHLRSAVHRGQLRSTTNASTARRRGFLCPRKAT
ncbi:uncharacterized protein LOC111243567 isoform X3 [Varroa destructor]|uniref:Uncharacterized protein n=1 Tax=Varroa destructor TaxID=109461 RepID=A0A7M7J0X7_VARDE|nr:uncharacterized protein LOC111243567 isoform X3 [Varroa destructor]